MLDNTQIAKYLFRGRVVDTNDYIVGTGVKIRLSKNYIFDETITNDDKWVQVERGSIERCTGFTDNVGTPIFENDVVLDTDRGIKAVIKYNDTDLTWTVDYVFVSANVSIKDCTIGTLKTLAPSAVVIGRYKNTNGNDITCDRVKYIKPLRLEPYDDFN